MISKLITSTITATIVGAGFVIATCTQISATKPPQLLQQAIQLRAQGLDGLEKFLNTHATELDNPSSQMHQALDTLCQ